MNKEVIIDGIKYVPKEETVIVNGFIVGEKIIKKIGEVSPSDSILPATGGTILKIEGRRIWIKETEDWFDIYHLNRCMLFQKPLPEFKVGDIVKFKSTDSENAKYFKKGLTGLEIGYMDDTSYYVYESDKSCYWHVHFDEVELDTQERPIDMFNQAVWYELEPYGEWSDYKQSLYRYAEEEDIKELNYYSTQYVYVLVSSNGADTIFRREKTKNE